MEKKTRDLILEIIKWIVIIAVGAFILFVAIGPLILGGFCKGTASIRNFFHSACINVGRAQIFCASDVLFGIEVCMKHFVS